MRIMESTGKLGRPSSRSGGVLIVALIAVAMVSVLALVSLQVTKSVSRRQRAAVDTTHPLGHFCSPGG